ncbi:MAG: hypothetical protein ACR2IK_22805 [Chloroflexota bacterium]
MSATGVLGTAGGIVAVGTTTGANVGGTGVAVGAGFCVAVRLGAAFVGVAGTDVGVAIGAASAAVWRPPSMVAASAVDRIQARISKKAEEGRAIGRLRG